MLILLITVSCRVCTKLGEPELPQLLLNVERGCIKMLMIYTDELVYPCMLPRSSDLSKPDTRSCLPINKLKRDERSSSYQILLVRFEFSSRHTAKVG